MDADLNPKTFKPDAPWGLVIYRTCYDDEAAWQSLIAELDGRVRRRTWPAEASYIPGRHRLVLMDDRTQFDGADRVQVRDHFRQWARAELPRNSLKPPSADEMREKDDEASVTGLDYLTEFGPRYNVFGVVDDICIESTRRGRVGPLLMLVCRFWEPMKAEDLPEDPENFFDDYAAGVMVDPTEGWGGWIYTRTCDYTYHYGLLDDVYNFTDDDMFMYPSYVYGPMGLERSPGFWREEMAAERVAKGAEGPPPEGSK